MLLGIWIHANELTARIENQKLIIAPEIEISRSTRITPRRPARTRMSSTFVHRRYQPSVSSSVG